MNDDTNRPIWEINRATDGMVNNRATNERQCTTWGSGESQGVLGNGGLQNAGWNGQTAGNLGTGNTGWTTGQNPSWGIGQNTGWSNGQNPGWGTGQNAGWGIGTGTGTGTAGVWGDNFNQVAVTRNDLGSPATPVLPIKPQPITPAPVNPITPEVPPYIPENPELITPEVPVLPGLCYRPQLARVMTKGSNLNLRRQPSMNADVIANIPNGAQVTVLGEFGGWSYVIFNNQIGYAATEYLRKY